MSEIDLNPFFEQLKTEEERKTAKLFEKPFNFEKLSEKHQSQYLAYISNPAVMWGKKSAGGGGTFTGPKPPVIDWFCTYCGSRNNGVDNHCPRCQADKR